MDEDKIIRYFEGAASDAEIEEIYEWFSASEVNKDTFYQLKAKYVASGFAKNLSNVDVEKGLLRFQKSIRPKANKSPLNKRLFVKYAAAIALIFTSSYFIINQTNPDKQIAPISIPEDAITLELPNGEIKVITENESLHITDAQGAIVGQQKEGQLVYSGNSEMEELEYNTLTVPYAKRFDIVLSDGTKVKLNSGTSIKYPTKFLPGRDRQVFLNGGEAYFDVAKNLNHPFIINDGEVNIEVLGTQFNVSSYPEDNFSNTVLVEGSVRVYNDNIEHNGSKHESYLEPGQIAKWDKIDRSITVDKADLSIHTAWINGKIIFKHTPFENIIKKLERHYDVRITNQNLAFANESFTASFDVETIHQVFETFKTGYGIEYKINGNEIIIEP